MRAACRGGWSAYMAWEAHRKSRSWRTISVSLHCHCCDGGCSEHLVVDLGRVEFMVLEKAEVHLPHYFFRLAGGHWRVRFRECRTAWALDSILVDFWQGRIVVGAAQLKCHDTR